MKPVPEDAINFVRAINRGGRLLFCHWYRENMRFAVRNADRYKKSIVFDGSQDRLDALKFRCDKIIDKIEVAFQDARLRNQVHEHFRVVTEPNLVIFHYEDECNDTYTAVFCIRE